MNGAQYALAALVGERPDEAQRRRSQWRQVALTVLAGLIGLAAALWISIQAGLYGWQAADWDRFEAATALLMPTVMLVMFPFVWLPFVRAPRALSGQPLREMIISGNPRLSPPLPLQPAPLPAEALDIAYSFTALRRPHVLWEMRDRLLPWMIVLPLCFPISIQLPRALGLDRLFDYRSPLSFLPLILAIGVFFVCLFALSRTVGASGPHLRIVADAAGVTWSAQRFPRAEWQAPWAAARSFTVAPYVDVSGWGASGLVYTLDTDQRALSWLMVPYANTAARTEANTLARLIVARTGLPLRDPGVWMARIKAAGSDPNALRDAGMPPEVVTNFQVVRHQWQWRYWLFVPLALVIVAVGLSPLWLPGRFQDAQRAYLDTLPALVHAETPLYRSSLAADDGNWPVSSRTTAGAGANRAFTSGAYQLSGVKGVPVVATMPRAYADAAVEVTALITSTADDSGFADDNLGLVVRANADLSDMIVVTVDQAGDQSSWRIDHTRTDPQGKVIQNDALAINFDPAFGTVRIGGPNTLLVLMRGDAFTLYINGVYVGTGTVPRFGERDPLPILPAGRVGVYVEDGANTAAFTNFAVYPVTSPPSLEYV